MLFRGRNTMRPMAAFLIGSTRKRWERSTCQRSRSSSCTLMPAGKHHDSLHESLKKCLLTMFANRVLAFDMACTRAYTILLAKLRAADWAIETADAFIASVALTNGSWSPHAIPTLSRLQGLRSSTRGRPRHDAAPEAARRLYALAGR